MDNLKTELPRKIKILLPYWVIVSVALIIAGICCLCIQSTVTSTKQDCINLTKYKYEKILELNYMNCTDDEDDKPCRSHDVDTGPCSCSELLIIPENITGDVVIFYRLDTFNESDIAKKENFYQSRDDNQLNGLLNDTPSEACKPFDYDEKNRTILPCGAIADAMFTDNITLHIRNHYVPMISYGILRDTDKQGFRNPENLTTAFQNFSKPKSWKNNLWELDPSNEENNGLQNEAFIAWMHIDWQEKPMWRLNRTSEESGGIYQQGMPADNYTVTITYNYPYSRYQGNRTIILKREYNVTEPSCNETLVTTQKSMSHRIGVAALTFGIIFLLLGVAAAMSFYVTERRKQTRAPTGPDPPKIHITPSNNTSENDPPTFKEEEIMLNEAPKAVEKEDESLEYVDPTSKLN